MGSITAVRHDDLIVDVFSRCLQSMQVWRHVGVEACRCGGIQVWRHVGLEAYRCGGMQVWRRAGVEAGRCGGMQVWRNAGVEKQMAMSFIL